MKAEQRSNDNFRDLCSGQYAIAGPGIEIVFYRFTEKFRETLSFVLRKWAVHAFRCRNNIVAFEFDCF